MRITVIILLLLSCLLCSCTSSVEVMKPLGDECWVRMTDGGEFTGELLEADTAQVIILTGRRVVKADLKDVQHIYIRKYSLEKEKVAGFVPGIILDVIIGVSLSSWSPEAGLIFFGHGVLSIIAIKISNPKVSFRKPFKSDEIEHLKLYARYPQGLTAERWEYILRTYGMSYFEEVSGVTAGETK